MRNLLLFFNVALLISSCTPENKKPEEASKTITLSNGKREVWAENIRSETDILKPKDFSDEDWKSFASFVDNRKIVNTLIDAVLSGKKKAYDGYYDSTELSIERIKEMINRIDTIVVQNPATGELERTIKKETMDEKTVDHIRFQENWYFDQENLRIEKEITKVCLVQNSYDEYGAFRGFKPLFWIHLKE
jgi:hypothetical protein